MGIGPRRVFRLSLTTALALAAGYALAMTLPFLAPVLAFILTAPPRPPMALKGLIGLLLVAGITLGSGLLMLPVLEHYPSTGLMLIFAGLFGASYLALNLGKGPIGMFLIMGLTLVTMMGQVDYQLALLLVQELMISMAVAIVCQWLVYPFFPEDKASPAAPPPPKALTSSWLAAQSTLIVFPSYLLGLTNPTFYSPIIMKSVSLGQQASDTRMKQAGAELLGSTLLAGLLAVLFWFALKLWPQLWMFFLWTWLFSLLIAARFYGVIRSRFSPSFWQNVMITLLILIGPAVADSANGKDPYKAFAVRMGLFIAVTLYAWLAIVFLGWLRSRKRGRSKVLAGNT